MKSAYKYDGRLLKPGIIIYNSGELNSQFGGDDMTGIYACTNAVKFAKHFSKFRNNLQPKLWIFGNIIES